MESHVQNNPQVISRPEKVSHSGSDVSSENLRNENWLKVRMTGPGGLYNIGNVLALSAGVLQSVYMAWGQANPLQAARDHLVGSPEAVWITVAILTFILAGEVYHRAFQSAVGPNARLVFWGDLLSGVAAIILTVGLLRLGDTVLALVAGVLLTVGKLGTALQALFWPGRGERAAFLLRICVVVSRAPSILALALALWAGQHSGGSWETAALPLTMIFCFILWLWADLLLFRPAV